jgi:hypothetical protein
MEHEACGDAHDIQRPVWNSDLQITTPHAIPQNLVISHLSVQVSPFTADCSNRLIRGKNMDSDSSTLFPQLSQISRLPQSLQIVTLPRLSWLRALVAQLISKIFLDFSSFSDTLMRVENCI